MLKNVNFRYFCQINNVHNDAKKRSTDFSPKKKRSDKNSENSHFSTFTHLAGSGRNHDISSEMSALGLS